MTNNQAEYGIIYEKVVMQADDERIINYDLMKKMWK